MTDIPIMGVDDAGVIHRVGSREDAMWTSCGLVAQDMQAILARSPTCVRCLGVDGLGEDIVGQEVMVTDVPGPDWRPHG